MIERPSFARGLKLRAQVIESKSFGRENKSRVAPPVMLMICVILSAEPRVKRENGTVTEMPGCKNEVRAEKQEKNEEKHDVEQREDQQPAELILLSFG